MNYSGDLPLGQLDHDLWDIILRAALCVRLGLVIRVRRIHFNTWRRPPCGNTRQAPTQPGLSFSALRVIDALSFEAGCETKTTVAQVGPLVANVRDKSGILDAAREPLSASHLRMAPVRQTRVIWPARYA